MYHVGRHVHVHGYKGEPGCLSVADVIGVTNETGFDKTKVRGVLVLRNVINTPLAIHVGAHVT